jgi:hypothetical protein
MEKETPLGTLSKLGFFFLIVWLIAGTTISSCRKNQDQTNVDSVHSTYETTTPSPTPTATTTSYVTEYPSYKTTTETELASNRDTIVSIRQRLKEANAKLRASLDREERALEAENDALRARLETYKDQGSDNWVKFKSDFDRSMDSIRNALRDLRNRVEAGD